MTNKFEKYLNEEKEATLVNMDMFIQGFYKNNEPTKGQIMKDIEGKYRNIKIRRIEKSYDKTEKLWKFLAYTL